MQLKKLDLALLLTGLFIFLSPYQVAFAVNTETTQANEKIILDTNNNNKNQKTANKVNLSQLDVGEAGEWTLAEERKIGDEIALEIYQDPDLLDDPILSEYVKAIGAQLINTAVIQKKISPEMFNQFAWQFFISKDKSINAFALPGGYFGVHLGLISMTQSRDELASVLAHEISHVSQRHISRNNANEKKMAPAIIGAMILGAILSSKSEGASQATITGAQALGVQSQLNYSRDMERESDRFGYALLKEAGFNASSFGTMFEKLQYANRLADSGNFPYLRSHPLTTERIGDMKARDLNNQTIDSTSTVSATPTEHLSNRLEHSLISARSKIFSLQAPNNYKIWTSDIQNANFNTLPLEKKSHTLMLAAVHAFKQQQYLDAEPLAMQLWQLLGKGSNITNGVVLPIRSQDNLRASRIVALLLADIHLQKNNLVLAENWLMQSEKLNTQIRDDANLSKASEMIATAQGKNKRPELFIKAQLASKGVQTDLTGKALLSWLAFFPRDAVAWQHLSRIHEFQNNKLGQLRALAEIEMIYFNWQGAKDRLKAAQNWADSVANLSSQQRLDLAIIDSRFNKVAQLLREHQLKKPIN